MKPCGKCGTTNRSKRRVCIPCQQQRNRSSQGWLDNLRWRAKKQGLPFNLTIEDLTVPEVCPLLGIPLAKREGKAAGPNSPSVDRLIPALGYVKGNVRIISYQANAMKRDATPEQLTTFAHNLIDYLKDVA